MKLIINDTCYTHLMWMLTFRPKEFSEAVHKYDCTSPEFNYEGVAGYVGCSISFDIKDLKLFAKIFNEWYAAENRSEFYGQIVRGAC